MVLLVVVSYYPWYRFLSICELDGGLKLNYFVLRYLMACKFVRFCGVCL